MPPHEKPHHPSEQPLLAELRRLVDAYPGGAAAIEDRLGLGGSAIYDALKGRKHLTLAFLMRLLEVLEAPPAELFARVYGGSGRTHAESALEGRVGVAFRRLQEIKEAVGKLDAELRQIQARLRSDR